eukprot:TRINITY_DN60070_c0_g1_i1.p1 TRINITY_DN60070_c0_g1~~TRINITY_DN60070_c0_g1_i1.p1  ORF type:complete len:577 (-),score=120.30 TRINITY_DN60070_c0_g1_i1:49-1674(-)
MVEVSTSGQRGYIRDVRERVIENVFSVQAFEVKQDHLGDRTAVLRAKEQLASRAEKRKGFALPQKEVQAEEDVHQYLQSRLGIRKALAKFRRRFKAPSKNEGNVLTYGWIFFVNLLLRNILLNVAQKFTQDFQAVGAVTQMLIHAANIILIISFHPYQSVVIVKTEAIMLTILFLILWCIVTQDLLWNHSERELYADVTGMVLSMVDILAVTLVSLVPLAPLYNLYKFTKKAAILITGPDVILNEIYLDAHMRKVASEKNDKKTTAATDAEEKEAQLTRISEILPSLSTAMRRLNIAGYGKHVNEAEQRRHITKLERTIAKVKHGRLLARQLADAALDAQKVQKKAEEAVKRALELTAESASAEEIEAAKNAAEALQAVAFAAENKLEDARTKRMTMMIQRKEMQDEEEEEYEEEHEEVENLEADEDVNQGAEEAEEEQERLEDKEADEEEAEPEEEYSNRDPGFRRSSESSQRPSSYTERWSHDEALEWLSTTLDSVLQTEVDNRSDIMRSAWDENEHHLDPEMHESLKTEVFQKLHIQL